MALIFGKDEEGLRILRRRGPDAPLEAGVLKPLQSGKPIDGEVVTLRRRRDLPLVFDVKTELGAPHAAAGAADGQRDDAADGASAAPAPDDGGIAQAIADRLTAAGPPQVATSAYRRGWDAIWGRPRTGKPN